MNSKVQDRKKAEYLRRQGYSYKDILKEVPVAKSTLSNWLKEMPLTKEEKQSLKNRIDKNISLGRIRAGSSLRRRRLDKNKELHVEAEREFVEFANTPLFFVGVALYWTEGAKRNNFFAFSNSDVGMINIMILWIETFLGINKAYIRAQLYIHKPYANENCEEFWSKNTGIKREMFRQTIYKPTGMLVKKRPNYKGCLRISLPRSSGHLRKMAYWQQMLVEFYSKSD